MLGTKNRFAALKIDDDDDESPKSKGAPTNQNQSNSAAKKKNKKKTKEADEALRSMAFCTGRPGTKHQAKQPGNSAQQQQPKTDSAEEWAKWQEKDNEMTQDMYEKQLQMALLASRQDAEEREQIQKQAAKEGRAAGDSGTGAKKKKKKDKPQTMTLGTFQQLPPETLPGSDDENEEPSPPPIQMRVPIDCKDELYFQNIDSAANKIVQRERMNEEFQKEFAQKGFVNAKYEEEIERLRRKIKDMKSSLEKQAEELKEVKEQNAYFCRILAKGNMKDKETLLVEVEELTADKEHLTGQLGMLQAELEKERSKNHALKLENDKFKGKHGK